MKNETKIDPFGFREYDARLLYPKNINLLGIEDLGKGLGTQIIKHTKKIRKYPENLNNNIPYIYLYILYIYIYILSATVPAGH